jgi:hypothetical protein
MGESPLRKTSTRPQSNPQLSVPATCIRYSKRYGGYRVLFFGIQHGGIHYRKADALAHAEQLVASDRDHWLADHGYGV